jgi:hypothetical protein
MLDILHNNQALPDDPDFFLIKNKKPEKKDKPMELKQTKKSNYPQDVSSNSPSNKFGKAGYMSSSDNLDDSYGHSGSSPKSSSMNNPNKLLEIEQKKLLTILEANEKIQQKLNKLLSMSPGSKQLAQYSDDEYSHTKFGKKLPGIRGGENNPFSKMAKANYKSSYERKKNLKPISKETYDRLTGNNKINSYYDPMSYSMGFMQNKALSKEEQLQQMKQLSQSNQNMLNQTQTQNDQGANKQTDIGKTEEKKKEEVKKDDKSQSPKKKDNKSVTGFDMTKIDPAMLQNFMMMTQNMNLMNMGGVSPQNSQTLNKKTHFHVQRVKRELEPVCNLGFIPQQVDKDKELKDLDEKNKKKFKGPEFFDNKHNKTKFKYLEEQKKDNLVDEINKSVDERGRRDDYDDLKRSQDKAERERQRIENERLAKEKAEKERKEKEQKEKEKAEKERKEKEMKKEEAKEEKKEEKPEEKKEEKKEEAKK